ncbi:hypothetical protein J0X19_06870 [Hymenobacter sp. BT186]|uniref:Uncharacterized protein n=1 Tax=Hymenobacter telluris TaxID=2816474 RepID=A0A939EUV9_9BACT|nr:hypothetical protein [Hymenobacter telluris]MBW3373689.1 hypothetical protein [Hymenobacter norwichensis]
MTTRSLGFSELSEQHEWLSAATKVVLASELTEQSFVLSFMVVIDGYVLGNLGDIDIQLGGHPDIRY